MVFSYAQDVSLPKSLQHEHIISLLSQSIFIDAFIILHSNVGTVPPNREILYKYRNSSCVKFSNVVGMVPVNGLPFKRKEVRFTRFPNVSGIVPVN